MNKARLYDIILTSLIGAGIAFLQSMLMQMHGSTIATPDPALAGVASAGLKYWVSKSYYS